MFWSICTYKIVCVSVPIARTWFREGHDKTDKNFGRAAALSNAYKQTNTSCAFIFFSGLDTLALLECRVSPTQYVRIFIFRVFIG